MSRLVVLKRARIGKPGVDTTVKSSEGIFHAFAPRWDIVVEHKAGRMSDQTYIEAYLGILSGVSKAAWRALWNYGLQNGGVAPLRCYCPVEKEFCHNELLIAYAVECWPKAFCREQDLEPILFTKDCPTWGFLSNFSPHGFTVNTTYFPTVEHFYQSCKCLDSGDYRRVTTASTPASARCLGRIVQLPSFWSKHRLDFMRQGLYEKFTQDLDLRERLLATAPRQLIEHAPWDSYWGSGKTGDGKNMLGQLLMELRSDLLNESAPVER